VPNAREVAWNVLNRVDYDGAFADLALHAALRDTRLERRDRALATEITYGTLRMRGRIDALISQVLDKDRKQRVEPRVRNLLRLGTYQLFFLDGVRAAAAVDESVKLAKRHDLARASGFVNAVLRRLADAAESGSLEFAKLSEDPVAYLRDAGSLPEWIAERWLEQFGAEEAAKLAERCLVTPLRTIRVSESADLDEVTKRLGGRPCRFAPRGVTDLKRDPVRDDGFAKGEFTVQDEASQLAPLLLGAQPGDTVIDCCAAPGTKATQLAEQVGPDGEVIALELHKARLSLIYKSADRLQLKNLRVLQRDSAKSFDLQGRLHFEKIIVDAPCSGLGTLQRNPDIRWRLQPKEIPRLVERQEAILYTAARYVERKGVLVYSVCTNTPEETDSLIQSFLESHHRFRIDDPRPYLPEAAHALLDEQGVLRTVPHRHACDGFYAVRLVNG